MDEMHLGKNKYISTKRAAKITGYAQDYVGQLVRTGKVKATKVGRSWFVLEEDALRLSGKPAALKSPERALAELENRKVASKQEGKISFSVEYPKTWSQVQYFPEEAPLLPISDNRESFINNHSIEILDEHRVRISTGTAGKYGPSIVRRFGVVVPEPSMQSSEEHSTVRASSFDGVRYDATPLSGAVVRTDLSSDNAIEVSQIPADRMLTLGSESNARQSSFDLRWFIRVLVSVFIVSFFALLIPIL